MGIGEPEITIAKIEIPLSLQDSGRLVDAVIDLFSPLTEVAGTLGDRVRLYRIKSVLQTLSETKRLAEEAGIRLKQPPLKFLIPYLEGLSKEDPGDKGLQSMWANLLLQASSEDGKAHPLLVEVLTKLTTKDAGYLEKIVRNPRWVRRSINQVQDAEFNFDKWDNAEDAVDELIDNIPESDLINTLIERFEDRGTIVTSCGFYSIDLEDGEADIFEDYDAFPESDVLSLHSLSALGLVKYPINIVRRHKGGTFIMTICVMTTLGAEFYLCTHAPELRVSPENDLPPFISDAQSSADG